MRGINVSDEPGTSEQDEWVRRRLLGGGGMQRKHSKSSDSLKTRHSRTIGSQGMGRFSECTAIIEYDQGRQARMFGSNASVMSTSVPIKVGQRLGLPV